MEIKNNENYVEFNSLNLIKLNDNLIKIILANTRMERKRKAIFRGSPGEVAVRTTPVPEDIMIFHIFSLLEAWIPRR